MILTGFEPARVLDTYLEPNRTYEIIPFILAWSEKAVKISTIFPSSLINGLTGPWLHFLTLAVVIIDPIGNPSLFVVSSPCLRVSHCVYTTQPLNTYKTQSPNTPYN